MAIRRIISSTLCLILVIRVGRSLLRGVSGARKEKGYLAVPAYEGISALAKDACNRTRSSYTTKCASKKRKLMPCNKVC
eukprot:1134409-Pelagomonas_calceolata.AAC.1